MELDALVHATNHYSKYICLSKMHTRFCFLVLLYHMALSYLRTCHGGKDRRGACRIGAHPIESGFFGLVYFNI